MILSSKKILLIIWFSCFLIIKVNAQSIKTIAGNGIPAYAGDGGPATLASIGYTPGVALDAWGNLYIADADYNRIRKVDVNTGIITTFAGTGTLGNSGDGELATNAALNMPEWLTFDKYGNLYVSDLGNNRIRKISVGTNIITTIAGNGQPGYSGDSGLAINASIWMPGGITFDKEGNLYFADVDNNRIRKINAAGIISTIAGNGISGFSGDGGLANTGKLSGLTGLCVDSSDNLYIVNNGVKRVRKITLSNNIITTVAGNGSSFYDNDGISAISAGLDPFDVTFFRDSIYIADYRNHRIRAIDVSTGVITTVAGNGDNNCNGDGGMALDAGVRFPEGVKFDLCGNMYISDYGCLKVRKVSYDTLCIPPGIDTTTHGNESVQNITASDFTLYPNPANTEVTLSAAGYINSVAVYNTVGQIVYNDNNLHTQHTTISIATLPAGIYFIKVNNAVVKKVVKE